MTNTNLRQLEDQLQHQFSDLSLLETALTHRSFLNESGLRVSNERLEYLGDAVLELIVTEHLYHQMPDDPEGVLTSARAAIVRTESLAKIAVKLSLGEYLRLSRGEEKTGGRTNESLLANTFEAVLGSIYLDSDLEACRQYLSVHLFPFADSVLKGNLKDAKSLFQEKVQELGYSSPVYQTISESGPDHDKHFQIAVLVGGHQVAIGEGKNKQLAQQAAASAGLENLPPRMVQ